MRHLSPLLLTTALVLALQPPTMGQTGNPDLNPVTGLTTAEYVIPIVQRPSWLAWVKDSLWISEFDGKIWRLPFRADSYVRF